MKFNRMKKLKTIAVDFDGVLASYDGWKGFNVLGQPNFEVINAVNSLYDLNYHILIFTTRKTTLTLKCWLKKYKVKYHAINSNKHNPPNTSIKPIYDCIIDDRAVNYHGQFYGDLMTDVLSLLQRKEKKNG